MEEKIHLLIMDQNTLTDLTNKIKETQLGQSSDYISSRLKLYDFENKNNQQTYMSHINGYKKLQVNKEDLIINIQHDLDPLSIDYLEDLKQIRIIDSDRRI